MEPRLVGRRVESTEVHETRLREPLNPAMFEEALVGRRFERLRRRAKYLLADLSDGETLVVHLGMSGRLSLVTAETPRERHEHVAIEPKRQVDLVLVGVPPVRGPVVREIQPAHVEQLASGRSQRGQGQRGQDQGDQYQSGSHRFRLGNIYWPG